MPEAYGLTPEEISQASAQTHQQVSPQSSGLDELRPPPWWKRKMMELQQGGGAQGQPQIDVGGQPSSVSSWASLGKGVGNLAKTLVGMEHGGAVQGPTMALIGEGGEEEAVLPKSKALPFSLEYLRTGNMPNPANLPRVGGTRPPPPVILPPQMCNGGKVMPRMAGGGIVAPQPTDYFNVGEAMPGYVEPVAFNNAPPVAMQRPQRTLPQRPSPSFDKRSRLAEMVANEQPQPKWYERLVGTPPGNSELDMRPGVAGYSMAGRAARGVLSNVLPFGRKREEFGRKYNAAQMDAETETAQNAAAQKQYESERAEAVARSQMDANDARRATQEAQLAKLNAPPPPVDPHRGKTQVDKATGEAYGVVPDQDGTYWVTTSNLSRQRPPTPPTPRNPTAASLAADSVDQSKTPEERKAAADALAAVQRGRRGSGGQPRENRTDVVARLAQRILAESEQGGGKTVADAIRNVSKFYQGDDEVNRYRPEIVKRLEAEAKARKEILPESDKDIEAIKAGLGIGGKQTAPAVKPPAQSAASQTLNVGGKAYKIGDPITLKSGKTVNLTKINQDGTFEAE